MVPLQYFLLSSVGVNPDLALRISFGTSLAIIIPTAISGAYIHHKKLNNIIKPGILLGIFGMFGGVLGGIISSYIPGDILTTIFGIFIIFAAVFILFANDYSQKFKKIKISNKVGAIFGLFIGFLSGLLGIGGGIFVIPLLVVLLNYSMREAIGISTIVISLTAIGGMLSYVLTGWGVSTIPFSFGYINLVNLCVIAIFSILFANIGAKLVYKIPEHRLKQFFALVMVYIGIKILGLDLISFILGWFNIWWNYYVTNGFLIFEFFIILIHLAVR